MSTSPSAGVSVGSPVQRSTRAFLSSVRSDITRSLLGGRRHHGPSRGAARSRLPSAVNEYSLVGYRSRAEEPPGPGVRQLLAVTPGGHAVDPHVADARAVDEQAVGAPGEIVDPLDGGGAHRLWVEGHQVGEEALAHETALRDAERLVGVAGQAPHRVLQ